MIPTYGDHLLVTIHFVLMMRFSSIHCLELTSPSSFSKSSIVPELYKNAE